ncbi:hypothetical protein DMB42_05555 [Nonomuraea sp. WAC 01424]|nr:hypothetical protein DMB42_05555 [Nonomuraea sp. WAC 01424]
MARQALSPLALLTAMTTLTAVVILAAPAKAAPPTWRWPLDGNPRILRRFAPPPAPWLAGHRGVDLAAPAEAPVLAAGPGTIRYAGSVGGRGVVTIDHPGGLRTTYLPVTASVKPGQPITMGDPLGVVQAIQGHCQESCLHWGLLQSSRYLDPLLLLGRALIRLLPLWPTPAKPLITPLPLTHPNSSQATLTPPSEGSDLITSPPPLTTVGLPNLPTTFPRPNLSALLCPYLSAPLRPYLPNPRYSTPSGAHLPPPPALLVPMPPSLLTVSQLQPPPSKPQTPPPSAISPPIQALTPSNQRPQASAITPETTTSSPQTPPGKHPLHPASAPTPNRQHTPTHSPATPLTSVIQLLTHAASTPTAPAIGLGTLLGAALLITALRRHRRPRKRPLSPRRGQHRKPQKPEGCSSSSGTC